MSVNSSIAINLLVRSATNPSLNLAMPGNPRYQPADLRPYLGYDQWAKWLAVVEWQYLETLEEVGVMPAEDSLGLTEQMLELLLISISTTEQDARERETRHDIIALQDIMRPHLTNRLHRWLHFGATSYDIIETAYALQLKKCFEEVFIPKLHEVDDLWRAHIKRYADTLQAGRTHLQTALPITVGCWLANLHARFVDCAREAYKWAEAVPGKFSGAVGTYASQRALMPDYEHLEEILLSRLDLDGADVSTQITPPEARARFYHELLLLSGVLANLGEDVRILQSSQFGEIGSASSTSSAMSHKTANPIAAEQIAGMYESVKSEYGRVAGTLVSDLQRDLRGSNVMRDFPAIMVYVYQQLLTTERLLKSFTVDEARCRENFDAQGKLVVAEALHLSLQELGIPEAHKFVNEKVVPLARKENIDLGQALMQVMLGTDEPPLSPETYEQLQTMPAWPYLKWPETYIGDAVDIARREAENEVYTRVG